VYVQDVNKPPTDIFLSNDHVAENSGAATVVGTLTSNDPDSPAPDFNPEPLTFAVYNDGAHDADNAKFTVAVDPDTADAYLVTTQPLNYEAQPSYTVNVRVSDTGGHHFDKLFTIDVDDVNEDPTANADSYGTGEDTALTVNATAGVLANDTDPDVYADV